MLRGMTLTILIPLLVCIIGALTYALATNAKLVELGRISFFTGLLVTLLDVANHVVNVIK